jgi:hypothetical protein
MFFKDIVQVLKFCFKSEIRPAGNQTGALTLSMTLVRQDEFEDHEAFQSVSSEHRPSPDAAAGERVGAPAGLHDTSRRGPGQPERTGGTAARRPPEAARSAGGRCTSGRPSRSGTPARRPGCRRPRRLGRWRPACAARRRPGRTWRSCRSGRLPRNRIRGRSASASRSSAARRAAHAALRHDTGHACAPRAAASRRAGPAFR